MENLGQNWIKLLVASLRNSERQIIERRTWKGTGKHKDGSWKNWKKPIRNCFTVLFSFTISSSIKILIQLSSWKISWRVSQFSKISTVINPSCFQILCFIPRYPEMRAWIGTWKPELTDGGKTHIKLTTKEQEKQREKFALWLKAEIKNQPSLKSDN